MEVSAYIIYLQAYNDSGCVGHALRQKTLFEDKLKRNKKKLKKSKM